MSDLDDENGFVGFFSFERLNVWQKSRELGKSIYGISARFPKEEDYCLKAQIRRAAISISSNIAEGCGRVGIKEQIHFIEIAFGSLMEVYSQLVTAYDLGYITADCLEENKKTIKDIAKMLSGLRQSKINNVNPQ